MTDGGLLPVSPLTGSSAATMLIFILPAAFYLRLVKSVPMRSVQKISVSVQETMVHVHTHTNTQLKITYGDSHT